MSSKKFCSLSAIPASTVAASNRSSRPASPPTALGRRSTTTRRYRQPRPIAVTIAAISATATVTATSRRSPIAAVVA
jgi:hypothetical protein